MKTPSIHLGINQPPEFEASIAMGLRNQTVALAAILLGLIGASYSIAGDCCCAHCGGNDRCQKVCRLVCEEKKIDVVCWGCVCEDFCLPKHNKPGCEHCKIVCADCDQACNCEAPYVKPKRFVWTDWIPGCATIHTKKKLMKKTETVTVKSFKWVVEDLCSSCEARCDCATIEPGDDVPPPPAAAGVELLYGVAVAPHLAGESIPANQ
jgi:hypothetical protein